MTRLSLARERFVAAILLSIALLLVGCAADHDKFAGMRTTPDGGRVSSWHDPKTGQDYYYDRLGNRQVAPPPTTAASSQPSRQPGGAR